MVFWFGHNFLTIKLNNSLTVIIIIVTIIVVN